MIIVIIAALVFLHIVFLPVALVIDAILVLRFLLLPISGLLLGAVVWTFIGAFRLLVATLRLLVWLLVGMARLTYIALAFIVSGVVRLVSARA